MTFTEEQQQDQRTAFIRECRQKAWAAVCHADWISKSFDALVADYEELSAEDRARESDIKEAEGAVDYHTVENRNKRKTMQEGRKQIAIKIQVLGRHIQGGNKTMM